MKNPTDKNFNIKMSLFQRSNLLLFLKRAHLTGEEVEAFLEIINCIQEAEEITEPINNETNKK
jgi:hypothetical protein